MRGQVYRHGSHPKDFRSSCCITFEANKIHTEVDREGLPYQMILGGTKGAYTLYDAASQVYLSLTSNDNKLHGAASTESDNAQWTITVSEGRASIQNNAYKNRTINTMPHRPVSLATKRTTTGVPLREYDLRQQHPEHYPHRRFPGRRVHP